MKQRANLKEVKLIGRTGVLQTSEGLGQLAAFIPLASFFPALITAGQKVSARGIPPLSPAFRRQLWKPNSSGWTK